MQARLPIGLALTFAGFGGLAFFIVVQTGLIVFMGLYTPVYATYRLELLGDDHVARGLTAWSVTSSATIAVVTGLWGVLATLTSTRVAIAVAGVLLLATPALLPRERARTTTGGSARMPRRQARTRRPGRGGSTGGLPVRARR